MGVPRTRWATGWVAAACIGLVWIGSGCGRKLLPIQPGVLPPPTVGDLAHEVQGNEVLLFWSLPAFNPARESAAAGFKVQRSRQSAAEAECRTCPAAFQEIAVVPATGRRAGSRMRFRDAVEAGFVYTYRVLAYTADDVTGKASDTVTVTF
jgi:hypothetical protein